MFAARLILSHQTAIRPIRQALNSLESALPQKQTCHFVTPIESTPFYQFAPFCTKSAPITPVSTTLTNTAPCNPIRMNTSEKHPEGPSRQNLATHSSKTTYLDISRAWSDHFSPNPAQDSRGRFSSTSLTSLTPSAPGCTPQLARGTNHGTRLSRNFRLPLHFALCNFHGIIEGYACR